MRTVDQIKRRARFQDARLMSMLTDFRTLDILPYPPPRAQHVQRAQHISCVGGAVIKLPRVPAFDFDEEPAGGTAPAKGRRGVTTEISTGEGIFRSGLPCQSPFIQAEFTEGLCPGHQDETQH